MQQRGASAAVGGGRVGEVLKGFKIYNTLSRDKETFEPMCEDGKTVKMYTCGPTIYDFAHIGNFRAFLTYDVLKRWLLYCGYDVDHICNLTDVDDKIIQRMKRDNVGLKELTEKFADAFFDDLKRLNIIPARKYPRATEHIDDIVEMINGLVQKGNAYEKDGSYYFDVSSFPDYGKLARLDFDNMMDGASEGGGITDREGFEKKSSKDFALWKAYKPEDGEVTWETKLSKGRPGWHIECSAMSRRYLGDSFDIHAGGVDLTFPHHENEIAQSEAYCGCQYCRYWVHNGFVNINNEKMSKSLGNFLTLREAFKDPNDCRAFRYLVVSSQYRAALNFAPDVLQGARNTLKRLDKRRREKEEAAEGGRWEDNRMEEEAEERAESLQVEKSAARSLDGGMMDDLNTPRACAALFTFIKSTEKLLNTDQVSPSRTVSCLDLL
ncbi:hypothetical protein GUITHDRAFT_82387 [Guillardia theta CCMP2712]|uniref:Cysteine--tRNA ligase n=1 Tax=Guillardia theta (strain CCMP2712) TaxID=905079 RepID=L1I7X3_GUITC|nr:hypothetical protein GUITHDRAFT_82387 [Guillardia theta CCMP2712]EKX32351.1 hypothetical protein GUITHDRAFT_82387 [Guillardia theta CCMP2712]|eukprot:XP_005819331.1 hypothetical protein GUITHDRAFT_82387 [Guillardia theta CCMP2712]